MCSRDEKLNNLSEVQVTRCGGIDDESSGKRVELVLAMYEILTSVFETNRKRVIIIIWLLLCL